MAETYDELAKALLDEQYPIKRNRLSEDRFAESQRGLLPLPPLNNALAGGSMETPRWRAPNQFGGDETIAAQIGDDARRGDWAPAIGGLAAVLLGAGAPRGGGGGRRPPKAPAAPAPQPSPKPEYKGQHGAPDHESGSPIHNVTLNGTYPADFYGPMGRRYYGTGNDAMDAAAFDKIMRFKDKPDEMVPVYRAIPEVPGKPKGVTLGQEHINPGDWVTISRDYAKDHGESALNGNYHLVKKMVPARELHTAGDSFLEWGWSPAKISKTE